MSRKSITCTHLIFLIMPMLLWGCSPAKAPSTDLNDTAETPISYGQKPPGLIPEIFAEGIISNPEDMEFGCAFTPDGQEIYYTIRKNMTDNPVIMTSRQVDGKWSQPVLFEVETVGDEMAAEPHITADGKTLYFGSSKQVEGATTDGGNIWQKKKTETGWSEMTYLMTGMFVSTTNDGSIYLTDVYKSWKLVKIPFDGETFGETIVLKGGPNTPVNGVHPCIARDESFIIYDRDGNGGEGELYVSFNLGDNTWSEGFNLGPEINSEGIEFTASLSPDGKYLFFMKNFDLYWVDIKIIDPFRPETTATETTTP